MPWIELGEFPTPVQKMESLGKVKGFPNLYVKRDDQSSTLYGGNKVRKLEFVLGDAQNKGRKLLMTIGGAGSNQVLATGIHGGRTGFKVKAVVSRQPNAQYVRKNLLLDKHYGVSIHHTHNSVTQFFSFTYLYLANKLLGRKPYYIPAGASSVIGTLGFVNAAFELKNQIQDGALPQPDWVIVAAGTLGTAAGLDLGCKIAGLQTKVIGVRISMPWYTNPKRHASLVNRTCQYMHKIDPSVPLVQMSPGDVTMLTGYLGDGYASFTEHGIQAVQEAKEHENISLDPTYTGKALGGGLDWLQIKGEEESNILFWNTYNSNDLSHLVKDTDYQHLPRPVHRYFEKPTQEETRQARSRP